MSYLRIRKKTTIFYFLFIFLVRRDWERNKRERQRNFGKVRFDSYMFLKIEIRSVKRNRERIEGTRDLKLKNWFSSSHFDWSKNRLDRSNSKETKILKNSGNFFLQNHLKNCFYDMTCMFMTSNDFQNQTFQRKIQTLSNFFNLFFPHSLKCIKHIKKFNFGGHKT